MRTFLLQGMKQDGGPGPRFSIAVEIDHIVEITRSRNSIS